MGEQHLPGHQDWRQIYSDEQVWSGNPNDALLAVMASELAGVPAGTALDVGCGEGADAIWLAQHDWAVTALDPAEQALTRGRKAAEERGVGHRIAWVAGEIQSAELPQAAFDVVSAFYPALLKAHSGVEERLSSLVKPGGALVLVAHAHVDVERARSHGFNPDDYVTVDDIVATLTDGWEVSRREAERNVTEGRGAHHHEDVIVVARKRA